MPLDSVLSKKFDNQLEVWYKIGFAVGWFGEK